MASLLAIFISSKSETPNCNEDCWREPSEILPFGALATAASENWGKSLHESSKKTKTFDIARKKHGEIESRGRANSIVFLLDPHRHWNEYQITGYESNPTSFEPYLEGLDLTNSGDFQQLYIDNMCHFFPFILESFSSISHKER